MPTDDTPGLHIAAYSTRANAGDWLLIRPEAYDGAELLSLIKGATVGTSSARRKAQLLSYRDDVHIKDLRGNVPTRVQRLRDGAYDAIILAAAGLERLDLDLEGLVRVSLQAPLFIPAPAQGVLAWQIREGDPVGIAACHALNDAQSTIVSHIERGILGAFKGGARYPLVSMPTTQQSIINMMFGYPGLSDGIVCQKGSGPLSNVHTILTAWLPTFTI